MISSNKAPLSSHHLFMDIVTSERQEWVENSSLVVVHLLLNTKQKPLVVTEKFLPLFKLGNYHFKLLVDYEV